MSTDPTQLYNPYNPFGPTGGLFSPFGSYFLPPTGQGQGLSLAPYSQQTWYGFNPWGQTGAGAGTGAGATPLNLWSLYQQLFPAGNALAGYSFAGAPQAPPPITTAAGNAYDSLLPLPPIPTVFTPPAPIAPTAPPVAPIGTSLTQIGGGGSATPGGPGGGIDVGGAAGTSSGGPSAGQVGSVAGMGGGAAGGFAGGVDLGNEGAHGVLY